MNVAMSAVAKPLILACLLVGSPVSAQSAEAAALIDDLEGLRAQFGVPGVAVVVVEDGAVLFAEGFGLRDVANDEPMSADTVFGLHSATKSFTAAAMLKLEQDGELDIDDRVRDHLPWFRVDDEYISSNMTLRDALAHRTGLPRTGMIYQGSGISTEEATRRLSGVRPIRPFRYSYTYQNMLYNMMSLIIESKTGADWSGYVEANFLDALEMSQSTAGRSGSVKGVRSKRYFRADYNNGALTEIPPHATAPLHDVSAPAGGIVTTAVDLGQWLTFLLREDGEPSAAPVNRSRLESSFAPHVLFRSSYYGEMARGSAYQGYGLGWFVGEFDGTNIAWHGGNGDGESTLVAVMPDRGIGLAVLANLEGTSLTYAAAGLIFDRLTEGADSDWYEAYERFEASPEDLAAQYREYVDARVSDTKPSRPLADYAGVYSHEIYGDLTVKLENDGLVMYRDNRVAALTHWHYDTFEARHRGLAIGFDTVTFNIGADGRVVEIVHFDMDGFYRQGADAHR